MTPIVVPAVGESISEVQISQWLKKEGEWVAAGTDLVDLETEKASVQISAPVDGILFVFLSQTISLQPLAKRSLSFNLLQRVQALLRAVPRPVLLPLLVRHLPRSVHRLPQADM